MIIKVKYMPGMFPVVFFFFFGVVGDFLGLLTVALGLICYLSSRT